MADEPITTSGSNPPSENTGVTATVVNELELQAADVDHTADKVVEEAPIASIEQNTEPEVPLQEAVLQQVESPQQAIEPASAADAQTDGETTLAAEASGESSASPAAAAPAPARKPWSPPKKALTTASSYFVKKTLDTLSSAKESRKRQPLRDAVTKASTQVQNDSAAVDPTIIFEPLRLACESAATALVLPALDCIGKLVAISFFDCPAPPRTTRQASGADDDVVVPEHRADAPTKALIERVVDTVCDCFGGEGTDDKVQLQIVKALLSAVLDDNRHAILHQTPLLKAIRQVYNIFLLSRSAGTQSIAQGTLEQMVHAVFARVKTGNSDDVVAPSSDTPTDSNGGRVTLDSFARRQSFDQIPEADPSVALSDEELLVKDAFLIFRSMCKLSTKTLAIDTASDLKSHMVRSKLLSLHMISNILNRHLAVFFSPKAVIRSSPSSPGIQFLQATKQYLCYALSRNAVSHIPQVFEVSCEIFWRMLSLRTHLKREIEVFLIEIYLPILEMKTSTYQQKLTFMDVLARLSKDPRALVELYLNYDCDRSAADNIYERIMNDLTRITATQVALNATQQQWQDANQNLTPRPERDHTRTPSLSIKSVAREDDTQDMLPQDYQLKQLGMRCLIDILRALVEWADNGIAVAAAAANGSEAPDDDLSRTSTPPDSLTPRKTNARDALTNTNANTATVDDPTQFENLKLRKTAMADAVKLFNFKPKKGLAALIRHGFLRSTEPLDVARFLLHTDGLNKATIGEYLGEGDELNIRTMHEFVNLLDFDNLGFVEALRRFLQTFRLPGEAQKIDRFMLKFADRYIQGNPGTFANADTAYVLAYSVIMLNTDAHSAQIAKAKKMSKTDFLKNNGGINDGQDLDQEYLEAIYDEIQSNEIVLKEEQDAALINAPAQASTGGAFSSLALAAGGGRDLQREAYVAASQEMANKSEARFRNLAKGAKTRYYNASHFEHVGPMFEVVWMPILASLSGPLQNSDDVETVQQCLEGFRHAIRIACIFDIELARNAFVRTLAWFTSLSSINDMKLKNLLGVKTILAIALSEGNDLKDSWREVLTAVSQLERLQLITAGIEEDSVPEISNRASRASAERPSFQTVRRTPYMGMIGQEARSRELTIAMDRIFTSSAQLSGTAIVHFVRALSAVSSEEIASSAHTDSPRLYSLQKIVEISYYNMARIRFEWSNIWAVLGDHFNAVGCNANTAVSFFALDALRQLASRFLEIDELPNFKFQKDFLRPFEHILAHNPSIGVKDMVLQCLVQMIRSRAANIKSGWQTILSVFTFAAKEPYEPIVNTAFENVRVVTRERMDVVLAQGSFPNFVSCLTVLAKNHRFQRTSLQALDLLRSTQRVLGNSEDLVRFWFPILYGFHDILMSGEDMEVRSRALQYLFEALTEYGDGFTPEFWDIVCRQLLFPIFFVLKSDEDGPKLANVDDLTIWLSSTLVEALRSLINLYTRFFPSLERMTDGYLDLLSSCICQENDTLARIGSACLQQLISENATKFNDHHWTRIVKTFENLFHTTTAHQLFRQGPLTPSASESAAEDIGSSVFEGNGNSLADTTSISDAATTSGQSLTQQSSSTTPGGTTPTAVPSSRKREFNALIVKCVLQLLLIEAVAELLTKHTHVYSAMPTDAMLLILDLLRGSWAFAGKFNADRDLRVSLWRMGFMRQMPNLLRQEVASAHAYLRVLMKLYADNRLSPDNKAHQQAIDSKLIPACNAILTDFAHLDPDSQSRNLAAWRPVVAALFREVALSWPTDALTTHLALFYDHAVEILSLEGVAFGLGSGSGPASTKPASDQNPEIAQEDPSNLDLRRCLAAFFKRVRRDFLFPSKTNGNHANPVSVSV
ncbi:guanine nucleotide exchange protein for ADP-robosylation factor [Savitreella phatthalungensis]